MTDDYEWLGHYARAPEPPRITLRERLEVAWANTRNRLDAWRPPAPARAETFWTPFEHHPDPLSALIDHKRIAWRDQLYLGLNEQNEPAVGAAEAPLLVLGPAGSSKTTAIVIPNVLVAPGPCLCISSRQDIFKTTARIRWRVGTIWNFSPTGKRLRGAKLAHYDPFAGAEDPTVAQSTGKRWASMISRDEYALISQSRGHVHFRDRGAAFMAALARISQLWTLDSGEARGIGWASSFLVTPHYSAAVGNLDQQLRQHENGDRLTSEVTELKFLLGISTEERGSILTTVANSLAAYRDPAVLEAASGPSFDFDAFVRGEPNAPLEGMHGYDDGVLGRHGVYPLMSGRYDTVYVTDADAESPTAFVLMDFEFRVREAMYRYSEELEMDEM